MPAPTVKLTTLAARLLMPMARFKPSPDDSMPCRDIGQYRVGLRNTVRVSPLQQLYRCAINCFRSDRDRVDKRVGKARCRARLYIIETLQTMSYIKDPGFKPIFHFSRFAMHACRWCGLSGVF